MEKQAFLDYADPVYLSNVLAAIMGGGMGGFTLLKLGKIAEQEAKENENLSEAS